MRQSVQCGKFPEQSVRALGAKLVRQSGEPGQIRAIRLGAISEAALGLGVIGLVAVLGTFEPM